MGLLSKIIAANLTTRVVKRLNAAGRPTTPVGPTAPRQEYLPANPGWRDRATQVYRENPKLVAGLGVAVAALALQQLSRRR